MYILLYLVPLLPGVPWPSRDFIPGGIWCGVVVLLRCWVQLSLFISPVSLCRVPVPLCHTNNSIMIIRSLISSTLLILANSGMLTDHNPHHDNVTSHYRQQGGHEGDPSSKPRPGEDAESPQAQGWLQTSPAKQRRLSRPHPAPAHTLVLGTQLRPAAGNNPDDERKDHHSFKYSNVLTPAFSF